MLYHKQRALDVICRLFTLHIGCYLLTVTAGATKLERYSVQRKTRNYHLSIGRGYVYQ